MDQSKVAGLGNLLVDEALFQAGLDPARPAGGLDDQELKRLHKAIRATLRNLTKRGGSHTGALQPARHRDGALPPRRRAPAAPHDRRPHHVFLPRSPTLKRRVFGLTAPGHALSFRHDGAAPGSTEQPAGTGDGLRAVAAPRHGRPRPPRTSSAPTGSGSRPRTSSAATPSTWPAPPSPTSTWPSAARPAPPGSGSTRPTFDDHGWASTHSVVEVVIDDMPFLLDSISMELVRQGCGLHLVVHPVIARRVVHPRRDRPPAGPASGWRQLRADLLAVLEDVRAAVEDWPAMRAQAVSLAAELQERPPPGEAEDADRGARLPPLPGRRPLRLPRLPGLRPRPRRRRSAIDA